MNKNTVYGLIVIGALLFGYAWYTSHQRTKITRQQHIADSIRVADSLARAVSAQRADTAAFAAPANTTVAQKGGAGNPAAVGAAKGAKASNPTAAAAPQDALSRSAEGTEELFTVENDLAKYTFSNKGGRIASVELKKFNTFAGEPVVLFRPQSSSFNIGFSIDRGYNTEQIDTGTRFFEVDTSTVTDGGREAKRVSMKLHVADSAYVEFLYTIPLENIVQRDYMIDFSINFVGMNLFMASQANEGALSVDWQGVSYHLEKSYRSENRYSTIFFSDAAGNEGPGNLGSREGTVEKDVNSLRWIAFKQQFFSSVFIAQDKFLGATMRFDSFKYDSGKVKDFSAKIAVPFNLATPSYHFNFYFGPNKYSLLRSFNLQLQKLVPLGGWIIGWVNRWIVIPVFDFLGGFISSFGLIIFLLTLFIKILIMPLTYKSYISQAKMRLVKPEIDELAKKFPKPEDAMKKQQATMELYKKAGINPLGGCIPLLIQFPILIAMFYFFPASIELRGQSFLWANDLSSYDSILSLPFTIPFYGSHVSLFALLMAASVVITSKLNYAQTASAGPQMAGMKFMMLYIMPIMMLAWFNDYASGLSYYYFLSNIITIGQTYAFRYAVDEKKLHEKMKANAKKPRKKSKWTERYEEMLKEQQKQARKR